jgi:glucose/arabinose dehydrogenase
MRPRPSSVAFLFSLILIIGIVTPVDASPTPPAAAGPASPAALSAGQVRLRHIEGGLSNPLGIVNAGDGTDRLFILEQRGTVRVVNDGQLAGGFFLDLRAGVPGGLSSGGERGLLGLAFHPDFDTNRYLFVYYTDGGGDLVIAQLRANSTKTSVPLSSYDELLSIEHSSMSNHNGGQLLFGPDGYLYIFTGDGGGGGDPFENGQNRNSLLGKTLRIDPDLIGGYSSPTSNPYHGSTPGLGQIWSIGLRNPWRASFDRSTDALWIADVGQGSWEEINREPAGAGGRNYGWDCREGFHPFESTGCSGTFQAPLAEYGHGGGNCSVTGGYVYRGDIFLDFRGQYVLGDFCSGRIWTVSARASSPASLKFHRDTSVMISSFGEAENGEIYMTDYAGGDLYRVIAPPFSDITNSKFLDDIMWLYNEKATTGCTATLFCPKDELTRGQLASLLARALHLPMTSTDFFTDDDGTVHEPNINRIAAVGITTGCAANRYCPSRNVTRAEMATFLDRAVNLPLTGTDFFTDDDGLVHEDAINRVAAAGITLGCAEARFCPDGLVNREVAAAFLHRAIGE